jgi:hypothetical protein
VKREDEAFQEISWGHENRKRKMENGKEKGEARANLKLKI